MSKFIDIFTSHFKFDKTYYNISVALSISYSVIIRGGTSRTILPAPAVITNKPISFAYIIAGSAG